MTLILDPATEQRLQRQLARGPYTEPSELLAHALDLLEAEEQDLAARRAELAARLQRGFDQATRSELYSPDEARAILAERRAARMAK
jgi:Arc/MetJ-type ribon-helix-helix transcriptional regulator